MNDRVHPLLTLPLLSAMRANGSAGSGTFIRLMSPVNIISVRPMLVFLPECVVNRAVPAMREGLIYR